MAARRVSAGFREIEHTADLGFEVWAEDLPRLFVLATLALAELVYDRRTVGATESRELRVSAPDTEQLLVRWLHEVYLLLETERWLTASADEVRVESGSVVGRLSGERYDPMRHQIHTEIKAITYHDLEIREEDGQVRTRVIVDV